ncbi:MAG TPA: DUF2723 domain-containing protein [Vicinamibacterales bacterium]
MVSRRDAWLAFATFVLTLAFFVVTLRPDVGGTEDSPKFQFVGRVLGTSHSPGYPFYAMATWAFGWLPIGNLAYRINLFSAVCGALSCMVIFLTARRLGVTALLSLVAALAAATSYPVWSNSVTAEVYTLAAVLSGGAVYLLIAFAQSGGTHRLYAACALWAAGFGNHLTIVAILPAAVIYGVWRERSVLQPRVVITAALIGLAGVAQYAFIAIRTLQGAPYLEARATTVMGVYDVIIARDVSWARFYQAQSAVAAIEVPMLLNGIRVNMGTIPIILVAIAIGIGIWKKNAEILLILGAAGGTLGMIANLWGDVVGFITPVCVQLWPLAALGVQMLVTRASGNASALAAAGAVAMIAPVTNGISNWPRIELLREPGEGPGVRALYAHLPARSALVAENYWLARLVNYMHFSGEVTPDPNPRVLDSDASHVRAAVSDGLEVYAFEGATHWLGAQGLRFERTDIARQPFAEWIAQQPRGTVVVATASGRGLPLEWLPIASRSQSARPSNYGALIVTVGSEPIIEQNDTGVSIQRAIGSEGRAVTIGSSDEGPRIMWGDDVLTAIDRGLAVAAFSPAGALLGSWGFSLDETPGVQPPPTPFVLRGEVPCEVLRPGQRTDVTGILSDGGWLATVEGKGRASIALDTTVPPSEWKHRVSNGRGEASIESQGSRLILDPVPTTRSIFRFTMIPGQAAKATLEPGDVAAVRVCQSAIPPLPATGSLEVTADRDAWFGPGWHLGERGGTQRFRWSQRESSLVWRMEKPAPVRMLLHLRPASGKGATIQAALNGKALPACTLPAGAWTDCRIDIPEASLRAGINQLTLTADTVSPSADRPGDVRELAFAMQVSRVRIGR